MSRLPVILGIFFQGLILIVSARAVPPTSNFLARSNEAVTVRNVVSDIRSQIKNYALPYGGLGFLSHILTYYTEVMLVLGRRPLMPWKNSKRSLFDSALSVCTLIVTTTVSGITIARCRTSDPFNLSYIAGWKLALSLMFSVLALCRSQMDRESTATAFQRNFHAAMGVICVVLLCFYWIGVFFGLIGLGTVLRKTWQIFTIKTITRVFLGFMGAVSVLMLVVTYFAIFINHSLSAFIKSTCFGSRTPPHWFPFVVPPFVFIALLVLLFPFWADWTLAAAVGNWTGWPSSDVALLYWAYFIAKRLPILMI